MGWKEMVAFHPFFMQKSLRIFLCLQNNRYLCGVFVIGMHP